MSDELWETIDWGDDDDNNDDDNDTINQEDRSMVSSTIDTKETAGTVRLSGASTASESVDTPSFSTRSRRKVVEVQQPQRDKRACWFDFEDELEDEQAFLNHSANRFQRVKTDSPTRNATSRSLRAAERRQADYTIEKSRRSAAKKPLEEREERPTCHSFTWKLQQMNSALQRSVRLVKNAEISPVPDDEGLDVPFPLNARSRRRQ